MANDSTHTQSSSNIAASEPKACIQAFAERYGEAHFRLACHAALPLSLTPDFLYRLWGHIQDDYPGELDPIPWLAVSDFLITSGFCKEVGHDLYELEPRFRQELLRALKEDPRFGENRIQDLAQFTLSYAEAQLRSSEPMEREYAEAQRWGALAYTQPKQAAKELAHAVSQAYSEDSGDLNRVSTIVLSLQ